MITPQNQQPRRSVNDDAEYRQNYLAAEYVNALFALDNGWTGRGVTVGIIDDGVFISPELEGQVDITRSRDFGGVQTNGLVTPRTGIDAVGDRTSTHGTAVASIIAARNNGSGVQGLAPDVTIVSLRSDAVINGNQAVGLNFDSIIGYAISENIKVLNASLSRIDATVSNPSTVTALSEYREFGGILIQSAGNNAAANPQNILDLTPDTATALLFVVAIEPNGRTFDIASYSNRCGTAMNRCVAASGTSITAGIDGQIIEFSGTSAAAPQVSSLAAMILSKWPQLSGVDAGNIILNTARDIGAPGVDAVFGHGLINVAAALAPANPTLSNGTTSSPVTNTAMVVSNAFGASASASIQNALSEVTVLDAYGRDYTGDMSDMVLSPLGSMNHNIFRRVLAQSQASTAGFSSPKMSMVIGTAAFDTGLAPINGELVLENRLTNAELAVRVGRKTQITAGFNSMDNVIDDVMGLAPTSDAMLAYSPVAQTSIGITQSLGKSRVSLNVYSGSQAGSQMVGALAQLQRKNLAFKLGFIDEDGTVFGTPVGIGALRFGDGARTAFAELGSGFDLGKWSFDGFASLGATRLKIGTDMLITDASTITSGRFGVTASRPALGGFMSFGIGQQLVALGGNATITTGAGYDLATRSLMFADRRLDMSGTIRPQLTFGYQRSGARSNFNFGAASDLDAGDVRALAAWQMRF